MTWLIGSTCKHGNMFSGRVLIIRGLIKYTTSSLLSRTLRLDGNLRFQISPNLILKNLIIGDYRATGTPLPIPNREVKRCIADGTARETVWESRSLPIYF